MTQTLQHLAGGTIVDGIRKGERKPCVNMASICCIVFIGSSCERKNLVLYRVQVGRHSETQEIHPVVSAGHCFSLQHHIANVVIRPNELKQMQF